MNEPNINIENRLEKIDNNLFNADFNNEINFKVRPKPIPNPPFQNLAAELLGREDLINQIVEDVMVALRGNFQVEVDELKKEHKDVPKLEVVSPGFFSTHERKVKKKIDKLPYTNDWLEERFAALEKRGYKPDPVGQLRTVIDNVEQVNESRNLRYLVTSGLAVELMTGYRRRHKDLDLVLMHPDVNDYPDVFSKTDNTSPNQFWGGLRLDNRFLTATAMRSDDRTLDSVYCAHPAITLVQKTSDAWGRAPREHDYQDSLAVGYWMMIQPERFKQRDLRIAKVALDSIDSPTLRTRTADRLNVMFTNHTWFTSTVCKVEQVAA